MSALAEADRDRLARLLGMLGSDFDGEVANAGRLGRQAGSQRRADVARHHRSSAAVA